MVSFKNIAIAAAVATGASAQRPSSTSICDYYTTALLKNNTAANQATLLTLIVNTVAIGNYTQPNVGIAVPGILAPGYFNGTFVNLAPYFNGGLASTNRGGSSGVSVNFLDDGGATPLLANMPSNTTTSNQYKLVTHLYQYFGVLLGCSLQGGNTTAAFPSYQGSGSQYNVHKFMALNSAEVGYFIQQVGLAAASFGVAQEDVTAVGMALTALFDYKCAPPTVVVPSQGAQLQAICIADSCPTSQNSTCSSYSAVVSPSNATATASGTATKAGGAGTATTSGPLRVTGAASALTVGGPVVVAGLLAALL